MVGSNVSVSSLKIAHFVLWDYNTDYYYLLTDYYYLLTTTTYSLDSGPWTWLNISRWIIHKTTFDHLITYTYIKSFNSSSLVVMH